MEAISVLAKATNQLYLAIEVAKRNGMALTEESVKSVALAICSMFHLTISAEELTGYYYGFHSLV